MFYMALYLFKRKFNFEAFLANIVWFKNEAFDKISGNAA